MKLERDAEAGCPELTAGRELPAMRLQCALLELALLGLDSKQSAVPLGLPVLFTLGIPIQDMMGKRVWDPLPESVTNA